MSSSVRQTMMQFWQAGALNLIRQSPEFYRKYGSNFNLYGPKISQLVDQATSTFCSTVNSNVSIDLDKIRMKLLNKSKDPVKEFASSVSSILKDPYRLSRIVVTETNRAFNGGKHLAAQELGIKGKRWKVSVNACNGCIDLQSKGYIPIDDPFIILPGSGTYSIVNYPPLHPSCTCECEFDNIGAMQINRDPIKSDIRWLGYPGNPFLR